MQLSIARKLTLGFGAVILILGFVGFQGIQVANSAVSFATERMPKAFQAADGAMESRINYLHLIWGTLEAASATDAVGLQEGTARISGGTEGFPETLAELEKSGLLESAEISVLEREFAGALRTSAELLTAAGETRDKMEHLDGATQALVQHLVEVEGPPILVHKVWSAASAANNYASTGDVAFKAEYDSMRADLSQALQAEGGVGSLGRAALSGADELVAAADNSAELRGQFDEHGETLDRLMEVVEEGGDGQEGADAFAGRLVTELGEEAKFDSTVLIVGVILGILGGVAISVLLSRNLVARIRELVTVAERVAAGDASREVEVESSDEFGQLAGALQQVALALRSKSEAATQIATGDLTCEIVLTSDEDALGQSMIEMKGALQALLQDVEVLVKAAADGALDVRADVSAHTGEYANIVQSINDMLDEVVQPAQEAGAVLEMLAERDLSARVKGNYRGDHAIIKEAVNSTGEALAAAMSQVSVAVDQISAAGSEIASGAQDVAQGASEQASALEETSAALEEMARSTRANADNSGNARDLTRGAKKLADDGSNAMGTMMTSMKDIQDAAQGAAEIISDINQIAFQTNLLALNAAVEAARAGDAGRGFAVVAEEVRNLAQRSKEAASKTEGLIQRSVHLAGDGARSAQTVRVNLGQIVDSVDNVAELMERIAEASEEQNGAVSMINDAVAQMNDVTQQSAASAEQSSSSAEELASQTEELAFLVRQFKLQGGDSLPSRSLAPAQRPAPPPQPMPGQVIPMDDDFAEFDMTSFTEHFA